MSVTNFVDSDGFWEIPVHSHYRHNEPLITLLSKNYAGQEAKESLDCVAGGTIIFADTAPAGSGASPFFASFTPQQYPIDISSLSPNTIYTAHIHFPIDFSLSAPTADNIYKPEMTIDADVYLFTSFNKDSGFSVKSSRLFVGMSTIGGKETTFNQSFWFRTDANPDKLYLRIGVKCRSQHLVSISTGNGRHSGDYLQLIINR